MYFNVFLFLYNLFHRNHSCILRDTNPGCTK